MIFKLLPFICNHEFVEPKVMNECKPSVYCIHCGKVKNLPDNHEWETFSTTFIGGQRNEKGEIKQWDRRTFHLKCVKCGITTKRDGTSDYH
jgi:Fe2+ or Zn2+ uptake regulation protein